MASNLLVLASILLKSDNCQATSSFANVFVPGKTSGCAAWLKVTCVCVCDARMEDMMRKGSEKWHVEMVSISTGDGGSSVPVFCVEGGGNVQQKLQSKSVCCCE